MNIGECSVTCGSNGVQNVQRKCHKDDSYSLVPRDYPYFCGPIINETQSCSAKTECPSMKIIEITNIELKN